MKKSILLIFLVFFISGANAQFFPFQPVTDIPYFTLNSDHYREMILDSSIYECRNGCLQIMNVFNGKTDYRCFDHFEIIMLLPDMHGNYIYLKNYSTIEVYDSLLHDYISISTGPLAGSNVNSIGISPNGNIWALGNQKLGIYNGTSWQIYPCNNYSNLKVIDDTSAYLFYYNSSIFRFHNGIFDSLFTMPTNTNLMDRDIDSLGNLWIAGSNELLYFHNSTLVHFDSTNTPVGTGKFNKVVVGKNGHVWTCGVREKLFEYNGAIWATHSLPTPYINIDNFNLDSLDRPWVIGGSNSSSPYSNMNIYIWNGSSFNSPVSFPFMPYNNIKAIAPNAIADDEGVFALNSYYQSFQFYQFLGSPEHPEALDVNCFRTYDQYIQYPEFPFGTNNGIYNLYGGTVNGLDSTVLPSDTVNYILNDNGSDYVCTNNGMLIYTGVFYTTLNTSNSPLPSDTITFAITSQSQPYNKLYIGTSNGLAIYSNNQWTVINSSYLGLSNCYVTGILPSNYDTTTYVTTMGNGLIKLYDSGAFDILNTSNGNFQDDSLYYVIRADLADCGMFILIGTKENGLAFNEYWGGPGFQYYNTSNGYPFNESRASEDGPNIYGYILIGTNTGLYWTSPCGGIKENNVSGNLTVYPNPNSGIFTIVQPSGSRIQIYNIVGELIYETVTTNDKTTIDLGKQAKGMYFIRTTDRDKNVFYRKIIVN